MVALAGDTTVGHVTGFERKICTRPRFVAFLWAVNFGGHTVKIDRLRQLFESLRLFRS